MSVYLIKMNGKLQYNELLDLSAGGKSSICGKMVRKYSQIAMISVDKFTFFRSFFMTAAFYDFNSVLILGDFSILFVP